MSENLAQNPDATRFEIMMPNPTPEQIQALNALAGGFGWSARELTAAAGLGFTGLETAKLVEVSNAEFIDASLDMWASDIYGRTALSIIERARRTLKVEVHSSNGAFRLNEWPELWERARIMPRLTSGNDADDLEAVKQALEVQSPPFNLESSVSPDDGQRGNSYHEIGEIRPGQLRRDKLHTHMSARGFGAHALHGTLGKTLEVMKAVVGIDPSSDVDALSPNDYVLISDLVRIATEAGLKRTTIKTLDDKILRALDDQLKNGQPTPEGEVIIEGYYDASKIWSDAKDTSGLYVAMESLPVLANQIKGGSSPMRDFLRNFRA